jgi:hypothetical protein
LKRKASWVSQSLCPTSLANAATVRPSILRAITFAVIRPQSAVANVLTTQWAYVIPHPGTSRSRIEARLARGCVADRLSFVLGPSWGAWPNNSFKPKPLRGSA